MKFFLNIQNLQLHFAWFMAVGHSTKWFNEKRYKFILIVFLFGMFYFINDIRYCLFYINLHSHFEIINLNFFLTVTHDYFLHLVLLVICGRRAPSFNGTLYISFGPLHRRKPRFIILQPRWVDDIHFLIHCKFHYQVVADLLRDSFASEFFPTVREQFVPV